MRVLNVISLVSGQHVVEAVPKNEQREAQEEPQGATELSDEGDERVDPGLLLRPDVGRDEVIAQHEQTAEYT